LRARQIAATLPSVARSVRRRILSIVLTDATFERATFRDRQVWVGRCIHCNGHLQIALDGEPISRATIEHILPRGHGGTDDPANLALACARCNHQKGRHHDVLTRGDPRLLEVVERLRQRRMARWRSPPDPA
jgi:5-methylcytosine-specific restriction endonuclease McrA